MFGMGTGGTLRLLSPEILCCAGGFFASLAILAFACSAFHSALHLQNRTGKTLDLSDRRLRLLSFSLRFRSASLTQLSDQALDRLVSTTFIHYCTSSVDLSTSSSLRGLTCF